MTYIGMSCPGSASKCLLRDPYSRVESKKKKDLEARTDYSAGIVQTIAAQHAERLRNIYWSWLRPRTFNKALFGIRSFLGKSRAYIASARTRISKEDLYNACEVCNEDGYTSVGRKYVLALPYRCGGEPKGFLFMTVEK